MYKGIDDMPAWNWDNINTKGDLTWLFHKKHIVDEKYLPYLYYQYNLIQNEFIAEFGHSLEYTKALELQHDILLLESDMCLSKDASIQTDIDIKERDLRELTESKKPKDKKSYFMQNISTLSETIRDIDYRTITMRMYQEHINSLKQKK